MNDQCDPTDLGFRRIADALTPLIARILKGYTSGGPAERGTS